MAMIFADSPFKVGKNMEVSQTLRNAQIVMRGVRLGLPQVSGF
jgi:hypothetical protein